MKQIVTITNQGQLTIPKAVLRKFGITGSTKAVLKLSKNILTVEPKDGFWSLAGSAKTKIKLTDKELTNARKVFTKKWPKK